MYTTRIPAERITTPRVMTSTAQSSTSLFRRLTWQATVPIEVRLATTEHGAGNGADRYYVCWIIQLLLADMFPQMHAPRNTYLPLLIPEIRENLVELCLDDQQLAETDEKDWWFEEEQVDNNGFACQGACKWCVLTFGLHRMNPLTLTIGIGQ